MVTAKNYAAAIQLAFEKSKKLVPYGEYTRENGWPHEKNEYYWSVRERILETCRQHGVQFVAVISTLQGVSPTYGDEQAMADLQALADPVWGEVGGLLLMAEIHSM